MTGLRGPYLHPTVAKRFFEENKASIRSENTRADWDYTLKQVQSRHPDFRIEQFTKEVLKAYLTDGADARSGKPWAGGTIAKKRTTLQSLFGWAAEVGLIKADPSSYLKRSVRVSTEGVREHQWLTELQIETIFGALPDSLRGQRDAVVLGLGFYAGLREAEMAHLNWRDVRSDHLLVVEGKGGKTEQAHLGRRMAEILGEWRKQYAIGLGAIPLADPVLCRYRTFGGNAVPGAQQQVPIWGHGLGTKGVYDIVRARAAEAGFPGLAPHDLRRSFAGVLQNKGVAVEKISQALRHSNVATTSIYLSKNPSAVREALRDIDFG